MPAPLTLLAGTAAALEPVSVGLQFGFLAVLYLFLLWVARSALRDLRRPSGRRVSAAGPVESLPPDATGVLPAMGPPNAAGDALEPRLVVERAPGHTTGMEYDVGEGAILGRGDQAEIRLEDPFASSRHARLLRQGGIVVLEDLGSTNGTYLNEELLTGPQPLHRGDRVRIGDSEFTYVDQ
jgi:FHA domain